MTKINSLQKKISAIAQRAAEAQEAKERERFFKISLRVVPAYFDVLSKAEQEKVEVTEEYVKNNIEGCTWDEYLTWARRPVEPPTPEELEDEGVRQLYEWLEQDRENE